MDIPLQNLPAKDIDWVAFDRSLLDCLRTKTNHRFCRYDAFVWLVDNIKRGRLVSDKNGVKVKSSSYVASFTQIGEHWHWTRQAVSDFIDELTDINVITHESHGNYHIFSINSSSTNKIIL